MLASHLLQFLWVSFMRGPCQPLGYLPLQAQQNCSCCDCCLTFQSIGKSYCMVCNNAALTVKFALKTKHLSCRKTQTMCAGRLTTDIDCCIKSFRWQYVRLFSPVPVLCILTRCLTGRLCYGVVCYPLPEITYLSDRLHASSIVEQLAVSSSISLMSCCKGPVPRKPRVNSNQSPILSLLLLLLSTMTEGTAQKQVIRLTALLV